MKSKLKSTSLLNLYRIFLGLAIIEGILALWFLFRIPSESRNASLFNFSLQRVGIGFAILLILGIFTLALYDSLSSNKKSLKFITTRLETILGSDISHIIIKTILIIILVSSLASLFFYWFPDLQRFIYFLPNNYIFAVIGERAGFLIGWISLISLKILILYSISGRKVSGNLAIPVQLMVITWIVEAFIFGLFVLWSLISRKLSPEQFTGPAIKILILALFFSFWAIINRDKKSAEQVFHPFVCISIWLCVFVVSLQFAQWFNVWGPRPEDHFILQADAFLHGKLYFLKVPSDTHDLNFFNGHWYESKPPFPIFIIMPLVAIWGVAAFNINTFALVLSALAALTVYLILYQMVKLGWINLSGSSAIWLTALFAFGTVFWWLAIVGTVGPFSQVVTVLFCALAFLSVLKKWSPWVAGICLMAAIMSRPNVFALWPALVSIAIQLSMKEEKVNWKYVIKWCVLSAIPLVFGACLLLYYNFLRYGVFSDFGYGTLDGSLRIVQNVQKYGLFSPHFFLINLRVIFLALPELTKGCAYFLPAGDGISILISTPAIIFLLRKFKISWWAVGCWCSILLSVALLAMYSNTGANQYGYRYVMDFFIPVIMLIAYNVGERISGFMKTLIIASIFINYYGTISSMVVPC
jgi:hypothetical protein